MEYKQVIVVRRDLDMPVGKLAVQVAHASTGCIFQQMDKIVSPRISQLGLFERFVYAVEEGLADWYGRSAKKVILGVDNLDELMGIVGLCMLDGITYCTVTDEGRTVFDGKKTVTCVGIGPADPELIDSITGHLKLY